MRSTKNFGTVYQGNKKITKSNVTSPLLFHPVMKLTIGTITDQLLAVISLLTVRHFWNQEQKNIKIKLSFDFVIYFYDRF